MSSIIVNTANAERISREVLAQIWSPPPEVDYLAWAEKQYRLLGTRKPVPGRYNRELFPFFDEILKALSPADPCRIVTLMKSAQLGGTVLANIFTLGSMAMDPADILYVWPTVTKAENWSKMKLAPMLRNTTSLARLFPMKSRDGLDSLLYKERVDGRGAILIMGANAAIDQVSMKRRSRMTCPSGRTIPPAIRRRRPTADPALRVCQDPQDLDAARHAGLPHHGEL